MKTVESSFSEFRFSKGLEARLIVYFKKNYDLRVSADEAQLFLRSLARIYDALSKEPLKTDSSS